LRSHCAFVCACAHACVCSYICLCVLPLKLLGNWAILTKDGMNAIPLQHRLVSFYISDRNKIWFRIPKWCMIIDLGNYATVQGLRLALSKGHNRVGVSLPSPEDRNRSSVRNVVFSNIYNSRRWTKSRNAAVLLCAIFVTLICFIYCTVTTWWQLYKRSMQHLTGCL
jgi:hypothetical protein